MRAALQEEVDAGRRSAEAPVALRIWRGGATLEATVPLGPLGVFLDRGNSPREAYERFRASELEVADRYHLATARSRLDRFGPLPPLPGTRREVERIATIARAAGMPAVSQLGDRAELRALEAELEDVRWLHLATHGLMGSREHPYEAALALTPSGAEGSGLLGLEHIVGTWQGRLVGSELVVLSACETQRGARRGSSVLALPWGFFCAGRSQRRREPLGRWTTGRRASSWAASTRTC